MHKLTIVYGSEDGYTPGDAYDLFFGDDYLKEWAYRKGNQPKPSLATTWKGYIEKGGLQITQKHNCGEGSNLYSTNLQVKERWTLT
ncbi:MAG: hypothetical protein CR994_00320 [Maribacter sp.]|nr:MAG: hypothetical protein CR994_00320 [Maribacter sp.]